jgi:hypothetical protein
VSLPAPTMASFRLAHQPRDARCVDRGTRLLGWPPQGAGPGGSTHPSIPSPALLRPRRDGFGVTQPNDRRARLRLPELNHLAAAAKLDPRARSVAQIASQRPITNDPATARADGCAARPAAAPGCDACLRFASMGRAPPDSGRAAASASSQQPGRPPRRCSVSSVATGACGAPACCVCLEGVAAGRVLESVEHP